MDLPLNALCVLFCTALATAPDPKNNSATKNSSDKISNQIDVDYYPNYDYELSNNLTSQSNSEDTILPNPELFESKFTDSVDVLPNIELPDDSLADTDLHDHDFIDNLMYIYYGNHNKNGYTFGAEIIIIGAVLSCAAQFLTIICTFLRREQKNDASKLFLNTIFSLCIANLTFMLGVHATKYKTRCELIAITLHYMHFLTAVWIFVNCYYIYKRLSNEYIPKFKFIYAVTYGLPAVLILLCYCVSLSSYESKKFCWMSVQKGMFFNYMLPVTVLIVVTTITSLNGIRKINGELSKYELSSTDSIITTIDLENKSRMFDRHFEHTQATIGEGNTFGDKSEDEDLHLSTLYSCKKCLKALLMIETSYTVIWFITVLALDNANDSTVMPIMYAVCSCVFNWYIFAKSKYLVPIFHGLVTTDEDAEKYNNDKNIVEHSEQHSQVSPCDISDSMPLLHNGENFTELIELRTESISMIST